MPTPDRGRSAAAVLALVLLAGCGPRGGAENDRLGRIERRLDALEKRGGSGPVLSPAPARPGVAQATAAPAAVDTSTYQPGAVALVHAAPTGPRTLTEVPADSVGGFVYTGGPITLHDLSSRGVRYAEFAGVELQGWFKATQAGRYQFGEDVHGTLGPNAIIGADCALQVWLEDRVVGSRTGQVAPDNGRGEQHASLVVGADLQPGLYKLRLWTACAPHIPREARITVDLLVKAPGDLNLRGFKGEELLHQPSTR